MSENAKIAELTGKTIDEAVAAFAGLSVEDLKALHDAESAATKRKGLLAAIDGELAARELVEKENEIRALADDAGVKVYFASDIDAIKDGHEDRIAKLEAALSAVEAETPAKGLAAQPRKLAIVGNAEGPFLRIAFTDADDMTLPDLPELEFSKGAFEIDVKRKTVTLKQPIVFPVAVRRTEVSAAWLVGVNGDAVACSRLVIPLSVGGGTRAKINGGFLAFTQPVTAAADDEDDD